jgi:hypothetical protein
VIVFAAEERRPVIYANEVNLIRVRLQAKNSTDILNTMTTRRNALISIAGGTASTAIARALDSGAPQAHDMRSMTEAEPAKKRKEPTYFHGRDYQTLTRLVDLMIPRTDTPGAVDAQVQWRIDQQVSQNPKLQSIFNQGIKAADAFAVQQGKTDFVSLAEPDQISVLKHMNEAAGTTSESQFFQKLKELTLDWYYRSEEGLAKELGYKGNTYRTEFPGCTHPEHWPS